MTPKAQRIAIAKVCPSLALTVHVVWTWERPKEPGRYLYRDRAHRSIETISVVERDGWMWAHFDDGEVERVETKLDGEFLYLSGSNLLQQ